MNAKNNMFLILRQEDKIKKQAKKIKEDQQKKENEKKDVNSFSFDVSKYASWADMMDEYDEFFYDVDKLKGQEKSPMDTNIEKKKKKGKKKKKKVQEDSDYSSDEEEDDDEEEQQQTEQQIGESSEKGVVKRSASHNKNAGIGPNGSVNKKKSSGNTNKQKNAEKKKKSKKEKEKNNFENILLEFTKEDKVNTAVGNIEQDNLADGTLNDEEINDDLLKREDNCENNLGNDTPSATNQKENNVIDVNERLKLLRNRAPRKKKKREKVDDIIAIVEKEENIKKKIQDKLKQKEKQKLKIKPKSIQ
ncbi:conserved Plasmodium protein, unknown function [Plasmodium ovale]|uniref:Uncharacterized protein n=1 Tax=Plasmodium ovale TaxID=36330 RepID=A0A1C3KPV1_PLAOA|nr:conserved Plasmodium protein, unknown function [Plasmodium ovale]